MKSRVQRQKEIKKRNRKKKIKSIPKQIIKNIIYLLIGIVYCSYSIIRFFDNIIATFFLKLPRWSRAIILWSLVLNNLYHNFDEINLEKKEMVVANKNIKIIETIATKKENNDNSNLEKEKCLLDETSCRIIEKAKELNLSENQIMITVAISKWETGNYTSEAFYNRNNVGGMMCSNGLIKYNTLDEGITAFIRNLKYNYFDIGLTTLELIQPKYCPIGAENDPNNLNKNWLNGTRSMLNELLNQNEQYE